MKFNTGDITLRSNLFINRIDDIDLVHNFYKITQLYSNHDKWEKDVEEFDEPIIIFDRCNITCPEDLKVELL